MSLSQVRTYLKQQIALQDADLKEWRDSFNNENIPSTLLNKYYHIDFGALATSQGDNWIEDSWSVTLVLHKRGFSNPVEAFDELIDDANCIRLRVIDPLAVLTDNITSVETLSVLAEPIEESNDNTIRVSIEFNFRLTFYTS